MQKADADLGSLCLVSTTADLELQVNSSVQLAGNEPHFAMEELVSKSMNVRSAPRLWIMQGEAFKLVVSLEFDDMIVDFPDLVQTLAEKLQDSKMWHQLRLQPISMTLSNDRIITIQISHSTDNETATGRQQHHKSSHGLSYSLLRTHPSVQTLLLSTVHLAMSIKQRPVITSDQRYSGRSQQTILDLFDAGFRHALFASPKQRARGISLDTSDSLKTLAEFAPSVWSPGYLSTMSSRSMLLSPISHSLSHVGIANAKSATLRAKFGEVARRAGCSSLVDPAFPDLQGGKAEQPSIESRLWQAAQETLLKHHPSTVLEVLSADADTLPSIEQHEALDLPAVNVATEEYCHSEDSMMELEDAGYVAEDGMMELDGSGYVSKDNFFSSYRSLLPQATIGLSHTLDGDMLCT